MWPGSPGRDITKKSGGCGGNGYLLEAGDVVEPSGCEVSLRCASAKAWKSTPGTADSQ